MYYCMDITDFIYAFEYYFMHHPVVSRYAIMLDSLILRKAQWNFCNSVTTVAAAI
jgi:hypothetical protein